MSRVWKIRNANHATTTRNVNTCHCFWTVRNRGVRVQVMGVVCPITDHLTSVTVIWDGKQTVAVQSLNRLRFCCYYQTVNTVTSHTSVTSSHSLAVSQQVEIHRRTRRLNKSYDTALKFTGSWHGVFWQRIGLLILVNLRNALIITI